MAVFTKEFVVELHTRNQGYLRLNDEINFYRNYDNRDLLKSEFFANPLYVKDYGVNLKSYYADLNKILGNNQIPGRDFHVFILNTQQNFSGIAFKFKYFVLNKSLSEKFIETYFSEKTTTNLKLSFLTGEKEIVAEKEFLVPTVVKFERHSEYNFQNYKWSYDALEITLLFLVNTELRCFSSHLIAKPKIEIGLDDLQKVKDVKIEAISK